MNCREIELAESLRWCLGVLKEAATAHGLGLAPLPEIVQARKVLAEHEAELSAFEQWLESVEEGRLCCSQCNEDLVRHPEGDQCRPCGRVYR